MPPLLGATHWLWKKPADSDLAGRPVLVHFWSSGCPLCHEGMATIARWRTSFEARGLITVAVYQPRSDGVVDEKRVRDEAASMMRIGYACALDGDRRLEAAFKNPFSPGYYFFDARHRLRHRQMGNEGLGRLEELLDRSLEAGNRHVI
jgi:thiol-disulfide isomerase/thioredoxin